MPPKKILKLKIYLQDKQDLPVSAIKAERRNKATLPCRIEKIIKIVPFKEEAVCDAVRNSFEMPVYRLCDEAVKNI